MSHVQPRQQRQPRFTVQEVGFFGAATEKLKAAARAAARAAERAVEKAKNIKKRAEKAAEQIKEAVKEAAKNPDNPDKSNKSKVFMSEKLFVPPSGC